MPLSEIESHVAAYYTSSLEQHGTTARGVGWNSADSQNLRFAQLLGVTDGAAEFSLNDFGCGYGALLDALAGRPCAAYTGYDISAPMIASARRLHAQRPHCRFVTALAELPCADFTVASGIFNVKLRHSDAQWHEYMRRTVATLAAHSRRGFAFNVLTTYSDPELQRPDLHYADPLFWFDHCKRTYSRFVALRHDYPLYEFTILVRDMQG